MRIVKTCGRFDGPSGVKSPGRLPIFTGILLLALMSTHAPSPAADSGFPIRFDAELIRLRIVGDSLEVEGDYLLLGARTTDEPAILFYPFPRDSLLGGARFVSAHIRARAEKSVSWIPLRFETARSGQGVRWWLPPCRSGETLLVRAIYRQERRAHYARYIVTTTRAWREPLRRARFEITLPAGAIEPEFSDPFVPMKAGPTGDPAADQGPPARPKASEDATTWIWETTSFLPDHDISVRWKMPSGRTE